jgi:carbon storage regulator CsrA
MLVLSRKLGEQIVVQIPREMLTGPVLEMVVTVCKIKGDTVRIGIDAPEHVGIVRKELGLKRLN